MKNGWRYAVTLIVLLVTVWLLSDFQDQQTASAAPPAPSMPIIGPVAIRASNQVSSLRILAPQRTRTANSASATIVANFLAQGSHNVYGDICLAWPEQAKTAFNYALEIWASLIQSPLSIKTNACWTTLDSHILGYSGAISFHHDFPESVPGFMYPAALANALSQTDLNDTDRIDWDGDALDADADIDVSINANASWYMGVDSYITAGRYDMVTVVSHEIAHGLGFTSWMNYSGGQGSWGFNTQYTAIFDRYIENGIGQNLVNSEIGNPSPALGIQLLSNDIYFNGRNANAANGGRRPKLYAPSSWQSGSSLSHLDNTYNGTPNALMTYSLAYQEVIHDPGPITLGILSDLGWDASVECYILTLYADPPKAGTVVANPVPNCEGDKYLPLTNITLTANPAKGFMFSGWASELSRTPLTTLIMTQDKSITALFDSPAMTNFFPLVLR